MGTCIVHCHCHCWVPWQCEGRGGKVPRGLPGDPVICPEDAELTVTLSCESTEVTSAAGLWYTHTLEHSASMTVTQEKHLSQPMCSQPQLNYTRVTQKRERKYVSVINLTLLYTVMSCYYLFCFVSFPRKKIASLFIFSKIC